MGHNRNLADYAHHFDGTNIDLGSGNIETEGVLTYEDVTNVDAIGIITARTGVKVPDNQKVFLGTGDDLQIYHDGTHSYMYNSTGELTIANTGGGSTLFIQPKIYENSIKAIANGAVELYHDNSKKLETTTTGATVTGTLVSDGVTSELDLSAISSSISGTAVDIFVYDTRKDSDGGAWRKRTQHTSWYNETLNTSTRGSRKEFPAVAVIVSESSTVTIYDGDDPDLPMWMVFEASSANWDTNAKFVAQNVAGAVSALNAKMCVGGSLGISIIDFIDESHINRGRPDLSTYPLSHEKSGSIALRNDTSGQRVLSYGQNAITVDNDCNDIAMTVLPNAPIDDTTGLPVPTIAVATDGGTNIIKDDGTVTQGYTTAASENVDIHSDGYMIDAISGASNDNFSFYDISDTTRKTFYDNRIGVSAYQTFLNEATGECLFEGSSNKLALAQSLGLLRIEEEFSDYNSGLHNRTTSSYNTGWMHGDIKGAFLSDTTAESFSATNLVSEDFSSNWTGATNGVLSVSSGQLTITNSGGGNGRAVSNTFATTGGKKYAFIVKAVSNSSATYRLEVRGPELVTTGTTNGQTLVVYFNGTGNSSTFVELYAIGGSGASATYEDAYVVEIEEDRSVNDTGLQVFGTITKSAVATGADLVTYSGFSASNYLAQPYKSDLNPGSGSYSVVAWFKTESNNSGSGAITGLGNSDIDEVMFVYVNSSYGIYFDYGTSSEYVKLANSSDISMVRDGNWHQVVCQVTAGQVGEIYIDGIKKSTANNAAAPSTWSQWDTNYRLYVGCGRGLGTYPFTGSISLVRYSLSKMSPEQIKKIYEDEKVLFQENAACTLYGSSDAVTALAYDEDTELLHVGTSSGRSDFQGLRRINNTTTAVTTAISASDELIAEQ